jgi:CubicO group peptidase (beta-lactamase class C family)
VGDVTDPRTGRLVQTTRPFLPLSFASAGTTLMMSATDLVTFARALLNGGVGPNGARILSETAAARMTKPTIVLLERGGAQWGLGWMLLPGDVVHHSGGGPGVCSMLYAQRKSGRAFALLTNCDRWDALKPNIVDPILESWTGVKESTPKRQTGAVDPKPYEGVYENSLFRAEVSSRNGALALRMSFNTRIYDNSTENAYPATTLYPLGDHTFEATGALPGHQRDEFRFVQPDGSGRMQALACMLRLLMRVG